MTSRIVQNPLSFVTVVLLYSEYLILVSSLGFALNENGQKQAAKSSLKQYGLRSLALLTSDCIGTLHLIAKIPLTSESFFLDFVEFLQIWLVLLNSYLEENGFLTRGILKPLKVMFTPREKSIILSQTILQVKQTD